MNRYEYKRVYVGLDWTKPRWPAIIQVSDDDGEWQQVDDTKLIVVLNRLGAEGWQLVGGPEIESSAHTVRTQSRISDAVRASGDMYITHVSSTKSSTYTLMREIFS